MKEKFGKMEASQNGKTNSVMMIVCIFAVTFFIGTAIEPVLAGSNSSGEIVYQPIDKQCSLSVPKTIDPEFDPDCNTCREAMKYAINHSIENLEKKIEEEGTDHPFWRVDIVIAFSLGIVEGIKESGFEIKINYVKLMDNVDYWIVKMNGDGQWYDATQLLANITGVAVGVTTYLLTLCSEEETRHSQDCTQRIFTISQVITRLFSRIKIFQFSIK